MNRRRPTARDPQEVLERSPWLAPMPETNRPPIDVIAQLEEFAALLDRQLISRAEFERQKRKILDL